MKYTNIKPLGIRTLIIFCLIFGRKKKHIHRFHTCTGQVLCLIRAQDSNRLFTLAHTNCDLYSSLSSLAALNVLDGLVSSFTTGSLVLLAFVGFLGLHLLGLAILDILCELFGSLVSVFTGLGLLSADLLDGHTNDSLLDASGLARFLLLKFVNFNLLVVGSPCHGPGKLDRLDLLVVEAASLGRDEVVSPTVLRDEAGAAARHDFVLREGTLIGLSNHF